MCFGPVELASDPVCAQIVGCAVRIVELQDMNSSASRHQNARVKAASSTHSLRVVGHLVNTQQLPLAIQRKHLVFSRNECH